MNVKAIALLCLLAATGFAAFAHEQGQARLSGSTAGVVMGSALNGSSNDAASLSTQVRYRYNIAGDSFDGEQTIPGDQRSQFRTGQRVSVCYDPSKPTNTHLSDDPFSCST
jgi:hypothetical protein